MEGEGWMVGRLDDGPTGHASRHAFELNALNYWYCVSYSINAGEFCLTYDLVPIDGDSGLGVVALRLQIYTMVKALAQPYVALPPAALQQHSALSGEFPLHRSQASRPQDAHCIIHNFTYCIDGKEVPSFISDKFNQTPHEITTSTRVNVYSIIGSPVTGHRSSSCLQSSIPSWQSSNISLEPIPMGSRYLDLIGPRSFGGPSWVATTTHP